MIRINLWFVITLFLYFVLSPSLFADGKDLYNVKGCVSCHGEGGRKALLPNYPILNGQNSAYLLQQILDIKSGARANSQSAVMKPFVLALSEGEMKEIADYLSKQK